MPAQAWGTATVNKGGGGGDPNVMKLSESNRVRLLDGQGPRKWRQHSIDGKLLKTLFPEVDENLFRSATCPRGPEGTGSAVCPCDMKGSYIDPETGKVEQLFPVATRYAANVWDYESGSVRVLIGGKQIFEEFDAIAQAGFDPTSNDFVIMKMGKGQQTSYKVIRAGDAPLPQEIKPEDLHDLDKYEAPLSAEGIFTLLVDAGVDYDAIPLPEFTLDEALQFVMPYTKKAKGLTMEQLYANDKDFMLWLYTTKREQGQFGDGVFQAMHTVLLHNGDVAPLEDLPKAPPRAAVKAAPKAPPVDFSKLGVVQLIPPGGGDPQEFPVAARDGLLAAGFTEPAPPKPVGPVLLVPPGGGQPIEFPPEADIIALMNSGFTDYVPAPADTDVVTVAIGGAQTQMPYGAAKSLIASGVATLVEA